MTRFVEGEDGNERGTDRDGYSSTKGEKGKKRKAAFDF